ncbi:hypothetical protein BKA62DRAFT_64516 [Auriculariales sp. MPI-PUGE-AT-0066]|nr:hypothetical protein BKA62DRAFT_64516 [Auriculariales sp. MPI-PUGE-AT-0066]
MRIILLLSSRFALARYVPGACFCRFCSTLRSAFPRSPVLLTTSLTTIKGFSIPLTTPHLDSSLPRYGRVATLTPFLTRLVPLRAAPSVRPSVRSFVRTSRRILNPRLPRARVVLRRSAGWTQLDLPAASYVLPCTSGPVADPLCSFFSNPPPLCLPASIAVLISQFSYCLMFIAPWVRNHVLSVWLY